MGLRQLFFLVENLMSKLAYVSLGLASLLIFIGLKLTFEALHHYEHEKVLGVTVPKISMQLSLIVIMAIILITSIASAIQKRLKQK
jgi:tellurite resistance protein TerC